jgi:hypothetical protein
VAESETGAELIAQERRRQVFRKRYDAGHDDAHGDGSLLHAGILLACEVAGLELAGADPPSLDGPWPDWLLLHAREKYGDDEVRLLAIAGAMIAAEIDRLTRAKERNAPALRAIAEGPGLAPDSPRAGGN